MDLGQALVLIFSFPVMGLLLFVLSVVETWLGDLPGAAGQDPARPEDAHMPAGTHTLILWPADRAQRGRLPPRKDEATRPPAAGQRYRQAG